MKLWILILSMACSCFAFGQADSLRLKKLETQYVALDHQIDSVTKVLKEYMDKQTVVKAADITTRGSATDCPGICGGKLCFGAYLLILAPIILFIIAFWMLQVKLKKNAYHISDALSTFKTETRSSVTRNLALDGTVTGGTSEQQTADKQVRSTSRLIAFLTGMVALIIAIVLTSYVGYTVITGCGKDIHLDDLWKILIALGIGVIPYGANVLNGNNKENNSTAKSS